MNGTRRSLRRFWTVTSLLFTVATVSGQSTEAVLPAPPSGEYPDRVILEPPEPDRWEYRFLGSDGEGHTDFFLPMDGPLRLDAPTGSEVSYHLEVRVIGSEEAETLEYVIDRLPPEPPAPSIPPGVYSGPVPVQLEATALGPTGTVSYLLRKQGSTGGGNSFRVADDTEGVELTGTAGTVEEYRLFAFATDGAKNRSSIAEWSYRVDRRNEVSPAERILVSPSAGSFANEQLLLVDTLGLRDISYTVTRDQENEAAPERYLSEFLVEGVGTFTATVTAVAAATGDPVTASVTWTQGATALNIPGSGRYTTGISVFPRSEQTSFRYNLEDLPVEINDDLIAGSFQLAPDVDAVRQVILRFGETIQTADTRSGEFRYVYLLDGRQAPPPDLVSFDGTLRLVGLADSDVSYRFLDETGTPLSEEYRSYERPISVSSVPDPATMIEHRSRYPGSAWGMPERTSLDRFLGETSDPESGTLTLSQDGEIVRIVTNPGGTVAVSDRPGDSAPIVFRGGPHGAFDWALPRGYRSDLVAMGQTVTVENVPPPPPEIVVTDDRFRIVSTRDVLYRIDGGAFQPYQGRWIRLEGTTGARRDRTIEAYAIDEDGEAGTRVRKTVTIDSRPAVIPPRIGGPVASSPEEIITNRTPYTITFANPYPDYQIHYEMTSDGIPRIPTEESPWTSRSIVVGSDEVTNETFTVRVRGRFEGRSEWSPLESYTVTIDRVPPPPPELQSPPPELTIARGTVDIAFAPPGEEGVRLFFRLRPEDAFEPYVAPFSVSPNAGYRTIVLEAYTIDAAGNRSYGTEPRRLYFDTAALGPPRFSLNGRHLSGDQVLLSRESIIETATEGSSEHLETYWRVHRVTESARPAFAPYREPFVANVSNTSMTYLLEAYNVDTLTGERSGTARLTVVLDTGAASPETRPFVLRDGQADNGAILWTGPQDEEVYAAITYEPAESSGAFEVVEDETQWVLPAGSDAVRVTYFVIDPQGRRSAPETITIPRLEPVPAPQIDGVIPGGIYNTDQRVILTGAPVIRYTVSTDRREPAPLHGRSTRYESPISLTASEGEDRTYRIRAAAFNAEGHAGPETVFSVRVDRRLPEPPTLESITSGFFFPDTGAVRFAGYSDGRIFFRVVDGGEPAGSFQPYADNEIVLPAEEGTLKRYALEAYGVDDAGNRSQSVQRWELFVDREIVYLAADAEESGGGDGTRRAPYTDPSAALTTLRRTGRRTLFLGTGTYSIESDEFSRTVREIPDLSVVGGFDPEDWTPHAGETVLALASGEGIELSGDARLDSLRLDNTFRTVTVTGGRPRLDRVSIGDGGEIVLRGGHLAVIGGRAGAVTLESGSPELSLRDATVRTVSVRSGTVDIAGLTGRQIHIGSGAAGDISRATLWSTPGDTVPAEITVDQGGRLLLRESSLFRGGHPERSAAPLISLRRGNLTIVDSVVQVSAENHPAVAIRNAGGTLTVRRSYLSTSGELFTYGIVSSDARTEVEDSVIALGGRGEQIGISATESTTVLTGSAVINVVDPTDFARAMRISGPGVTDTRIDGTLFAKVPVPDERPGIDGGSGTAAATIQRPGTSALERRSQTGTITSDAAIRIDAESLVEIRSVSFAGWPALRSRATAALQWRARESGEGTEDGYRNGTVSRPVETLHPILGNPVFYGVTAEEFLASLPTVEAAIAATLDEPAGSGR